jgi:hypothetical protein
MSKGETHPKHNSDQQIIEKCQFVESAELHRGHQRISNRVDPELAIAFSAPQHTVVALFRQTAADLYVGPHLGSSK